MCIKNLFAILLLAVIGACAYDQCHAQDDPVWVGSWCSAQQEVCTSEQLPKQSFKGSTLRETVHLSLGGERIRLRISNLFGEQALVLHEVTVARTLDGNSEAAKRESDIIARFDGVVRVILPAGTEKYSDAIEIPVKPLSSLTISLAIETAPACATSHPGAHATSFLLPRVHALDKAWAEAEQFPHWYYFSGIDVASSMQQKSIIAFGDSITDGHGATTDGDNRWTDILARRLASYRMGVINLGIGGNCVLSVCLGQSAITRFEHDALNVPGARTIIFFEGINDIGGLDRLQEHSQEVHDALVEHLEQAFAQIAENAHAHGMRILGATLTPFLGSTYYHPGLRSEADRQRLNAWIRKTNVFDGVVDFDRMMSDPARPSHIAHEVDSGDHLHPSPAGYRRMGENIPLQLLTFEGNVQDQSKGSSVNAHQ